MPSVDSDYVDLALAFAVTFFILSLIPSGLNEAVAFVTRIRSKFLWAYLNQLFTARSSVAGAQRPDSAAAKATLAVDASTEVAATAAVTGKAGATALPGSSRDCLRLMLAFGEQDPRPKTTAPDADHFVDRALRHLRPIDITSALGSRTTVKHIPPVSFAQAVLEFMHAADPDDPSAISAEIEKLKGTPICPNLQALWATSENDLARFRAGLERWFDAEMARLTGLYKRTTRWVLAVSAVAVAFLVNIDPIALGRDLWRDPDRSASQAELADAAAAVAADAGADPELAALFDTCRDGRSGESASGDAGEPTPAEAAEAVNAVRTCVVDALGAQQQSGLLNNSVFEWERFRATWAGGDQLVLRPFKLAVVAVAVFFGAPFWYDVLRRLVGTRGDAARAET
jgi:hypothetical protein